MWNFDIRAIFMFFLALTQICSKIVLVSNLLIVYTLIGR